MANTPFIGGNTLAYLLTLIAQDFAKKSELPTDTTYSISISGRTITLTSSTGATQTITIPESQNVTVDQEITQNSTNPVASSAIYQALSGKMTQAQVESAISSAIAGVTQIDFQIVQTLPGTGEKGTIYLVPNSGSSGNSYDEYIWVEPQGGSAAFEKIGTTDVDLSGYWNTQNLSEMTNAEALTIWNGVMNPQQGD